MPLKIYLADLTHVGHGIATDAFPLNIGLVASFAKKKFGKDIDITLFKYPGDLNEALKAAPPDILGCSNYTWNSNLSYYFTELAKSFSSETLTVWGGTNYPFSAFHQEQFLRQRPELDLHIFYEGEQAFSAVIARVLSLESSPKKVLNESIAGCQYISPIDQTFVAGSDLPRLKKLDLIPSPYVTGLFDKFFDGDLVPIIETARGCPFLCNFCNAGDVYFNKVNMFSDDYIKEELTYTARKISQTGVVHLTFADNNFGMIPRDFNTTKVLSELQTKYSWPKTITVWTGKNSKKRVIEATRLLGNSLNVSMSVQSMDSEVLKNLKRDNIRLEDFRAISKEINRQGRPQYSEVIMPSPGETLKSHVDGINALLDIGVDNIFSYTLQALHGTPYKDDEVFIKQYGYKTKYRIVPQDFTVIDNRQIFDVEEVAVATKDMSFDEYVEARKYLLVTTLCKGCFKPLELYLKQQNIKVSEWVKNIFNSLDELPPEAQQVYQSFIQATIDELWDTEEGLVAHFSKPENFKLLISGERGSNVLFRHRIWMLSKITREWTIFVFKFTRNLVLSSVKAELIAKTEVELDALERFVLGQVSECFTLSGLEKVTFDQFDFDILDWMKDSNNSNLEAFSVSTPLTNKFFIHDFEKAILSDFYQRYGASISGIAKLIQRRPKLPLREALVV